MIEHLSSKQLKKLTEQFHSLPGVGKKTALRYALHLIKKDKNEVEDFADSIKEITEIKYCKSCYNFSDNDVCEICSNPNRNQKLICVVEDIRDVIAIENTSQYKGTYHVLSSLISPIDGIGPEDLKINELIERIKNNEIEEIILALNTTIEGDTTAFYIYKKLKDFKLNFSTIARGIGVGDEIEYADELTLGKSILNRVPYQLSNK